MKAVIFDRDGVILDSEWININSAIKAFKGVGIEIKKEEKEWIIGRHPEDYKELFFERYDFSYEKFREIQRETYYELLKSAPLFDKTVSLIKELHRRKIPFALTTSSGLKSTLQVLEKADLVHAFSVIVTNEDYDNKKPHPEPYEVTAKKLNLHPKDCVAIEDSSVGIESAKSAGMKCIAIANETTKNQDLSKADLIVDSAEEISIDLLETF